MKNKTRRLAAFLLSAAVVITAVPGNAGTGLCPENRRIHRVTQK